MIMMIESALSGSHDQHVERKCAIGELNSRINNTWRDFVLPSTDTGLTLEHDQDLKKSVWKMISLGEHCTTPHNTT